jgi:hypothetical protein
MASVWWCSSSPSFPRSGACVGEVVEPVWCLCLTGEAVAAVKLRPFVPGPLPCSAGACSGAGGGVSGVRFRSGWPAVVVLLRPASPDGGGAAAEVGEWLAVEGSGMSVPDLERVVPGACRRPLLFCDEDPALRGWWPLRLFNAFWLGVPPAPWMVVDGGCFAGVRAGGGSPRWHVDDEDEDPQQFLCLYPLLFCLYLYAFRSCILATVG